MMQQNPLFPTFVRGELAAALGVSPTTFGVALSEGYVTVGCPSRGKGAVRRFSLVDAYQLAIFYKLYSLTSGSTYGFGLITDSLLSESAFDARDLLAGNIPPAVALAERRARTAERIRLFSEKPDLMPAYYKPRDPAEPYMLFITGGMVEVTTEIPFRKRDGAFINLTNLLRDLERALGFAHFPEPHTVLRRPKSACCPDLAETAHRLWSRRRPNVGRVRGSMNASLAQMDHPQDQ